jgi:two-component system chemotaxis response regulator CheB
MSNSRIRAVVVSDTAGELVAPLEHDADIAVIGQAASAAAAVPLIAEARPDIVIIDLNLRDGSGQQAIEQIMHRDPTPILALSTQLDAHRSPTAVEALVAGALEAMPQPRHWNGEQAAELRESVRRLSKAWVIRHLRGGHDGGAVARPTTPRAVQRPVVAIAASTGGPSALAILLADLGALAAPVLIVQHLHPDFVDGLREWMSRVSALPVEIARHGQVAEPGRVYLAPGNVHLRLGPNQRLELDPEPRTSPHRPSADILFSSVAEHAGAAGVGVVLTGMGDDGARGLLELRRRGGQAIAQDEGSSAVFGMPRAAQRIGAVSELLALDQVAASVRRAVRTLARSG